ncbi:Pentapeptide repeat family protein [Azospirillaceae bacterium]
MKQRKFFLRQIIVISCFFSAMGIKFMRLALMIAAVCVLGGEGVAKAECTDPAAPQVNWRRCFHDGRDMNKVDLSGAMLRDGTFQRSNLSGAILKGADAYRAKFVSAQLVRTDFSGARLIEADFTRADLTGALLIGADLRSAKLVNADLRNADLTSARLERADLRNADLSGARWGEGRVCAPASIGQCN